MVFDLVCSPEACEGWVVETVEVEVVGVDEEGVDEEGVDEVGVEEVEEVDDLGIGVGEEEERVLERVEEIVIVDARAEYAPAREGENED